MVRKHLYQKEGLQLFLKKNHWKFLFGDTMTLELCFCGLFNPRYHVACADGHTHSCCLCRWVKPSKKYYKLTCMNVWWTRYNIHTTWGCSGEKLSDFLFDWSLDRTSKSQNFIETLLRFSAFLLGKWTRPYVFPWACIDNDQLFVSFWKRMASCWCKVVV